MQAQISREFAHHEMQRSFLNGSTRGGFRRGLAIVICCWEQHLNQRADASALWEVDVLHALLIQACMLRTWDSYMNLACLSAHVAKRAPSATTSMIVERRFAVACGLLLKSRDGFVCTRLSLRCAIIIRVACQFTVQTGLRCFIIQPFCVVLVPKAKSKCIIYASM